MQQSSGALGFSGTWIRSPFNMTNSLGSGSAFTGSGIESIVGTEMGTFDVNAELGS